jgi:hypothetical protein
MQFLLLDNLHDLSIDKNLTFAWVPSHIAIVGNELADTAAKEALNLEIYQNATVTSMDLITTAKWRSKMRWNSIWSNSNSFMKTIKTTTERWQASTQLNRRQQVTKTSNVPYKNYSLLTY